MIPESRSHSIEGRRAGRPPAVTEAERRRRVVAAAEALFLERGYANTSMDDVARACGMSKKTLYRLFDHKQTLFAALVEAVLDALPRPVVAPVPSSVDGEATLRGVLGAMVDLLVHPRRLALARLVASEASKAPELVDLLTDRGIRRAEEMVLAILVDLRRAGALRVEPDITLARILMGAGTGDLAVRGILGARPSDTGREAAERMDRLFDLLRPALFGQDRAE